MPRTAGISNDCDHFAPSTWEERETAARFKSREGIQRIQSQWSDWEYEGYRASGLRMGIRRIQSQWSENGNTKDTNAETHMCTHTHTAQHSSTAACSAG